MEQLRELKLYTTICSSAPSELLVALAVRHSDRLIGEARERVLENLTAARPRSSPATRTCSSGCRRRRGRSASRASVTSATCASWCEAVAAESGVLLLPGYVYDEPRHVRMGYGRAGLGEALARLEAHMAREAR